MIEQSPAGNVSDENSGWSSYELNSAETPNVAVVCAVAAVSGRDPLELSPLYDVVDPDAIDRLFGREGDGGPGETRLRLVYEGYEVRVDAERVVLREADRRSRVGDYR